MCHSGFVQPQLWALSLLCSPVLFYSRTAKGPSLLLYSAAVPCLGLGHMCGRTPLFLLHIVCTCLLFANRGPVLFPVSWFGSFNVLCPTCLARCSSAFVTSFTAAATPRPLAHIVLSALRIFTVTLQNSIWIIRISLTSSFWHSDFKARVEIKNSKIQGSVRVDHSHLWRPVLSFLHVHFSLTQLWYLELSHHWWLFVFWSTYKSN